MFERSEETQGAIERVIKLAADFGKGDLIVRQKLSQALGEPDGTHRFFGLLRRAAKRILRDREIQIWFKSDGWHLLSDRDIPAYDDWRRKKGIRQTSMRAKALRTVNTSALSMHQRRLHEVRIDRLKFERRELLRSSRQLSEAYQRTQTNPRRPAMAQ